LIPTATKTAASEEGTVRRFRVNVPEEALVDLRRRLAATRWPSRETVADQSQGMQLAKLGTGPPMIERYPLEKAADAYAHVERRRTIPRSSDDVSCQLRNLLRSLKN
jgi:hypothetical protein